MPVVVDRLHILHFNVGAKKYQPRTGFRSLPKNLNFG